MRSAICLMLIFSLSACAELKSAGRTVGHTTRDVATDIGHATRDVTRDIGHGTRRVVKEIAEDEEENAESDQ